MIDLESLIQKTMTLEARYLDLQDRYQHLIHQYEELKSKQQDIYERGESQGYWRGYVDACADTSEEGRNRSGINTGSQDDLASKDD